MGVFYFEEKELPEYSTSNANNVLKIDPTGVYVQWLAETIDLPVQTGNANKLLTTNGTTAAWTPNLTTTSSTLNVGSTALNGTNLMTLNQNGPANFNVITPDYSSIFLPLTNIGITSMSNYFGGMDFNESTGVLVLASSTSIAGQVRLFVSGASGTPNYLTSFTTFTDSTINTINVRSIIYANNTWVAMGNSSGLRQLYYTTTTSALSGWTNVVTAPWNTSRTPNKLKYINSQFIVLLGNSYIRVSSDAITWTELQINATSYGLQDIEYLPELRRYVIGINAAGFLYYDNTTIPVGGATFTFVSVVNGNSNTLVWSSKLGLLLSQFNNNITNYSRDGVNWASYSSFGTWNYSNMIWINDFGGLFLTSVFQNTNNLGFSRDGFTWTVINNGFPNQGIRLLYNKTDKILINGMGNICAYKNLSSIFSTYLDPEATYITYNSNLKLKDNIEYEPQVITTATGNTHYTTQFFNRSVISFNTTNANANIYLQGASFSGRIGTKFKIVKTLSTNFGVRIHPYEACRIVTPSANILNYNITNSIYDLIPQGYYGSFDLTRVNDQTDGIYTGTWLVDNVNIYPLLGGQRYTTNVEIAGNLTVDGNINIVNLVPTGYIQLANGSDIIWSGATAAPRLDGFYDTATPSASYVRVILPIDANTTAENVRFNTFNTYFWKPVYNTKAPVFPCVFCNTVGTLNVTVDTSPTIICKGLLTAGQTIRIAFPDLTALQDGMKYRVICRQKFAGGGDVFLRFDANLSVLLNGTATPTTYSANTDISMNGGQVYDIYVSGTDSEYYIIRVA